MSFWLCSGRVRSNSDTPRPARPSAPLCSPALKASAASSRRASPGSRSRERERLGLAPSRRGTEAFLRGSAGRYRRHFRGTAPLAAELHPWLGAVTKDLAGGLYPARVIKRTGQYHRDIRHHLRLVNERRSACRAEASVSRFAAVTPASECLQRAL